MSVIAKGSKSLRKQDVAEQKSVSLSFKKIVFAHKASAGEAGINITSLTVPPEMSINGFSNPPTSAITNVNIYQHRNNVKIVSSLSGVLMPYLSYNINSSTYIAFSGFTAAQGEIFTVYLDEVPTTSLSVVDGAPIIASGTLLAGQTDFNIGTPIEINKYSAQQIGAVMVYIDRGLQYRKVGNISSGDGDYIEVPVAGGLGSLIRFDASASDRFVTVVSNGVVAERPDGSMAAMIENVQGQIDQIVPTVAALAGVSTTNFQISPNNVDLKQFGDTVLQHDTIINLLKTVSIPTVTEWQTYTPTITGSPVASGTNALNTGRWRRVGDSIQLNLFLHMGSTGTAGSATNAIWSLPNSLTADLTKLARGVSQTVGNGMFWNTATETNLVAQATAAGITLETAGGGLVQANAILANYQIAITGFIPITGWTATQTIAEILGI
jgi:hypothetical protein